MRYSPLVQPPRRALPRRDAPPATPDLPGPTAHERNLIDRVLQRAGYRKAP